MHANNDALADPVSLIITRREYRLFAKPASPGSLMLRLAWLLCARGSQLQAQWAQSSQANRSIKWLPAGKHCSGGHQQRAQTTQTMQMPPQYVCMDRRLKRKSLCAAVHALANATTAAEKQ
jgi:hypothetical protein